MVLLYITGNSILIHCLIITCNGKLDISIYLFIYIYVCVTESLCCTPETDTTL